MTNQYIAVAVNKGWQSNLGCVLELHVTGWQQLLHVAL